MKSSPGRLAVRLRAAFTLIELLAVMTIILVLAGLVISIAGSAQTKAATARATTEIHGLEVALESYKSDNGAYPPDPFTPSDTTKAPTDLLDPQKDFDPTNTKYTNNSEYLYQVLSGYPPTIGPNVPTGVTAMSKKYYPFTPQQLKAAASNNANPPDPAQYYIIDPFGFSYGYSTVYAANVVYQSTQPSTGTAGQQPIKAGYNPTFDLWSTAGYAPGGKSTPSGSTGDAATLYSTIWIKNW